MAAARNSAEPLTTPSAQTLDRGLRALEILAQETGGLSANDLATRLGVHRTISYRILGTLAEHHLVTRTAEGRFRLGAGILALSRNFAAQLQAAAMPELANLAEDLGATACLSVADGSEAVVVLSIEPRHTHIHVSYRTGFRHPLAVGASGIAILAGRPAEAQEREAITAARKLGYALTRDEIERGACGLAAPLLIAGRPAEASIGVVALGEIEVEKAAPRVREAAKAIEAALV
ncbi:MAG TPA: helix-turn-helix domain-containing protein [Chloroflexia bacterium]|nr:helix-turn-helix domain-containing protein [Chloroflexia bacterium]